jgi:hypothetical protein
VVVEDRFARGLDLLNHGPHGTLRRPEPLDQRQEQRHRFIEGGNQRRGESRRGRDLRGECVLADQRLFRGRAIDDLPRPSGDGQIEVDEQSLRGDLVRVKSGIVVTPPQFLDADRPNGVPLVLPPEQMDLAPCQQPLRGLDVFEGKFDGEDRGQPEVRKETKEGLRADDLVDPLHAEELEGGERVDDETSVVPAGRLHLQGLLESREGDLDAGELRGLPNFEGDLAETHGVPDRGDILERGPLVPHHIGNGIEDEHLVHLGSHGAVVVPDLIGWLLERDQEAVLAPSHSLEEELKGQGGLSRARWAADQVRPMGHQTAVQYLVQLGVAGGHPGFDGNGGRRRIRGWHPTISGTGRANAPFPR